MDYLINKVYEFRSRLFNGKHLPYDLDLNSCNELIYKSIIDKKPYIVSRFGNVELDIILNYLSINHNKNNINNKYITYIYSKITGRQPYFWKNSNIARFNLNAGFFPQDPKMIEKYCELIIYNLDKIDILGSWIRSEKYINEMLINAKRTELSSIEPFHANLPWTHSLINKKVLVIHPFDQLIIKQYENIKLIYPNELMPNFKLIALKAVQSSGGANTEYENWFNALEYMQNKIVEIDFDIAIIGAGAYGMPLSYFIKDIGKVAIHMGGVTQLLFGIKGSRWVYNKNYNQYFNKYWVTPKAELKPPLADKIENGCYW
jgi:hypothetical protein